jgi:hypothetical protein
MNSRRTEGKRGRALGPKSLTKPVLAAFIIGLAAICGGRASAATLTVGTCEGSSPYATIGEAVSAANTGDTVQVCPGFY